MAEPKGGPVKPPTLDLKAVKSNSPKSSAKATTSKATSAPRTTSKTSNAGPTRPQQSTSHGTTDRPKSAKTQASAAQPSKPPFGAQISKQRFTTTTAAIIGAIGGAFLALLLIIPLLLSGVFQPNNQSEKNAEIDNRLNILADLLQTNQERTGQDLIGFVDAMDQQVNTLRLDLSQQQNQIQTQVDQVISAQQNLLIQNNNLSEQNATLQTKFETAQASPPAFDATEIEQNIIALNARLDAIAAGASTEDAEILSVQIGDIQSQLSEIQTKLRDQIFASNFDLSNLTNQLEAQGQIVRDANALIGENRQLLEQQDLAINKLEQNQDQLTQENADIAANIAQTLEQQQEQLSQPAPLPIQQVPFAMMGIEIALNTGQPFLTQLESLSSQTPDIIISNELLHGATEGLSPPEQIANDLSALMPTILAARPLDPNANYFSKIGDSIKSILGLRATGLNNGDDVENLLNQTLAAIKINNFTRAKTLSEQLPAPMRATFPKVREQINLHASIQSLLQSVRSATPEPEPEPEPIEPATNELNQEAAS